MTTLNEAREIMYAAFVAGWGTKTPVQRELEKKGPRPPREAWVRVSMRTLSREQRTMGPVGGRKYTTNALFFVQLMTPLNRGQDQSDNLADAVKDILEGKTLSGVRVGEVTPLESGREDAWNVTTAQATVEYDETR